MPTCGFSQVKHFQSAWQSPLPIQRSDHLRNGVENDKKSCAGGARSPWSFVIDNSDMIRAGTASSSARVDLGGSRMDGGIMDPTDRLQVAREIMQLAPPQAADELQKKYGHDQAYELVAKLVDEILAIDPFADVSGHLDVLHQLDPLYLRVGIRTRRLEEQADGYPTAKVAADSKPARLSQETNGASPVPAVRWIVVDEDGAFADIATALEAVVDRWPRWRIYIDARGFARAITDAVVSRTRPWRIYRRTTTSDEVPG